MNLHSTSLLRRIQSARSVSITVKQKYHVPRLDNIEYLEEYKPGGYHPISIGEVLAKGRYRVIHKLGFGGSSTIWLARDQWCSSENGGELVTLKVLTAEQSANHPSRLNIQVIKDSFVEEGPNGSHLCFTFKFAGPSIYSISDFPGRVYQSRRLRGDIARKVAKQCAILIELLHSVGVVHGDLTTSNVLLQTAGGNYNWTDDEVYGRYGTPIDEEVHTIDGSNPQPHAPSRIFAPVEASTLFYSTPLQEDILLIDFGQSFFKYSPPPHYEPATPYHYLAPEGIFESKICFSSDIWALACLIFEIRAGCSLFEPFLCSKARVIKQMVETLGRLPEPWWSLWEQRKHWFDNSGVLLSEKAQRASGVHLLSEVTPLRERLRQIGMHDDFPDDTISWEGLMIEKHGTRLDETEVQLLEDLLMKMLRYYPEDRLSMSEVVKHPWFLYGNDV